MARVLVPLRPPGRCLGDPAHTVEPYRAAQRGVRHGRRWGVLRGPSPPRRRARGLVSRPPVSLHPPGFELRHPV